METKYAELISQLERVTEAYEAALEAVKAMEKTTGELPDILGVRGGVEYFGDDFEDNRAIHLGSDVFTPVALDCGSGFSYEDKEGKSYGRFLCTVFGYRVYALVDKGSAQEVLLMDRVARDE